MKTELLIDRLVRLSDGNPGAATVLSQLAKMPGAEASIKKLEQAGVIGSGYWILYKDICKQNIMTLFELIHNKTEEELLELSKE